MGDSPLAVYHHAWHDLNHNRREDIVVRDRHGDGEYGSDTGKRTHGAEVPGQNGE